MKLILLYFHTIRHLSGSQIFYQLYYRIKRILKLNRIININNQLPELNLDWDIPNFPIKKVCYGKKEFEFLNRLKKFDKNIDWNFNAYGKLWNYYLQYMDYLLDENIPVDQRTELLVDISDNILKELLPPEPYPVSLRLVNTLIFINRHKIQHEEINISILGQLDFLERNLELHIRGNHLLENYISLCFCHCMLSNKIKAEKYYNLLLNELDKQVFNDGGHIERTPSYHATLLSHLMILLSLLNHRSSDNTYYLPLKNICERMYAWFLTLCPESFALPMLNDTAISNSPNHVELKLLAEWCDLKQAGCLLVDSAYRILQNKRVRIIVNCGNISPAYQPGHSHADMVHFVLYLDNKEILVDPGVSTYENIQRRVREKSTMMHNTVSYAEENQSQVWHAFRMANRAELKILEDSNDVLTAETTWYNGITHNRKFILEEHQLIIEDRCNWHENAKRVYEANFHFDFKLNDHQVTDNNVINYETVKLEMIFENYTNIIRKAYWQSEDFNLRHPAGKISVQFVEHLKTIISWKE